MRPSIALIDSEVWLPVEGFEELYEVSSEGRVKTLPRREWVESARTGGHFRRRNGGIMAGSRNRKTGYTMYNLYKNGVSTGFLIHRLVATAFLPNTEDLPEVHHMDEDKDNNSVSNLEWCTSSYNSKQSCYKTTGVSNGLAILDEDKVLTIVTLLNSDLTQSEIGAMFGVSNHTVHKIKVGKLWNWLTRIKEVDND